jgi:hypothetical protein
LACFSVLTCRVSISWHMRQGWWELREGSKQSCPSLLVGSHDQEQMNGQNGIL